MIKAIFACDEEWGIGKNNTLPWPHNPEDLRWFKKMTANNIVVMGRNTWESLPIKPLPNRLNYVVTSDSNITTGYHGRFTSSTDISRAIKATIEDRYSPTLDIWIIGGAQLFAGCIYIIDEIYISRIEGKFDCDVFLPKIKIMRNYIPDSYTFTRDGLSTEKWIKIYA